MKIKILFLLIGSLMVETIYSQSFQWRLLPNSPGQTGQSRFEDMHFINSNTGWVVGYTGEVFRTTNAGITWNLIFTSTFGSEFRSVGFFDSEIGLIGTLIPGDTNIYYTELLTEVQTGQRLQISQGEDRRVFAEFRL